MAVSSPHQLFLGNLSLSTNERDLDNLFSRHGKVLACSKRIQYGFVEFSSYREAENAIRKENGRTLNGNRIVIEWSKGSSGDKRNASRHTHGQIHGILACRHVPNIRRISVYPGDIGGSLLFVIRLSVIRFKPG